MKYRKKPVVVDAVRFLGFETTAQFDDKPEWLTEAFGKTILFFGQPNTLTVVTLEGDMIAQPGDYIIRGIKGELYPCKPDIFEATYELVETLSR